MKSERIPLLERERERIERRVELRHPFLTIEQWMSHRGGHPHEFQLEMISLTFRSLSFSFLMSAKCGLNKYRTEPNNKKINDSSPSFLFFFPSFSHSFIHSYYTNRITQSTIDILSSLFFIFPFSLDSSPFLLSKKLHKDSEEKNMK